MLNSATVPETVTVQESPTIRFAARGALDAGGKEQSHDRALIAISILLGCFCNLDHLLPIRVWYFLASDKAIRKSKIIATI